MPFGKGKPAASKTANKAKAANKAKQTAPTKNGQATKSQDWAGATKRAQAQTKAARAAKPGSNFETPEIADGTYVAQVTGATAVLFPPKPAVGNKPAQPEVALFTISMVVKSDGDYEGLKIRRQDRMPILSVPEDDADEDTLAAFESSKKSFEYFSKAIQACYPSGEMDLSEFVLSDCPDMAKQLTEDKPTVQVTTKTNVGKNGQSYLTVYINKVAEEE